MNAVLARPRVRTAAGAALLLASLGALGGCGVAGTDFQPGVAAQVGDRTVDAGEVNRLTVAACDALTEQFEQTNTVYPLGYLSATIAQNLALTDAALQVGEEYGVTPSQRYERDRTESAAQVGELPEEQARAVEILQTTGNLVSDVLGQVGAEIAAEDLDPGEEPPGPATEEAINIGSEALQAWLEENPVELDPKYGVELTAEGLTTADTATSFGVSAAAEQGAQEQPDPAETMQLPPSQRCGSFSG